MGGPRCHGFTLDYRSKPPPPYEPDAEEDSSPEPPEISASASAFRYVIISLPRLERRDDESECWNACCSPRLLHHNHKTSEVIVDQDRGVDHTAGREKVPSVADGE